MSEDIKSNFIYYRKSNESMVLIPDTIYQSFMNFKQGYRQPEAGGIILGHLRGKHYVIDAITTPETNDVRKRTFYHRQDPQHLAKSKYIIQQQDYTNYLGEWHTHPQSHPQPSYLDKKEWYRITKMNKNKPLLFIIVGLQSMYVNCGGVVLPLVESSRTTNNH